MKQANVDPMLVINELREMLSEATMQLVLARARIAQLEAEAVTSPEPSEG